MSIQQNALMMARGGVGARGLFHRGQLAFHAAGAESAMIRFEREGSKTVAVTIPIPISSSARTRPLDGLVGTTKARRLRVSS